MTDRVTIMRRLCAALKCKCKKNRFLILFEKGMKEAKADLLKAIHLSNHPDPSGSHTVDNGDCGSRLFKYDFK